MTSIQTRLFGLIATSWGGLLLYFYHSMRVQKYLAPNFHHYVLVGGIGILILGVYSVINPQPKKAKEEKEDGGCCGHDHSHDHDHQHDHDDHHHHEHDHDHCDSHGHEHSHDHDHSHEDCGECDHDHDEGHGPAITALLTIIPMIIAMTYTTDKLSIGGLSKKGLYDAPTFTNAADRPPFTHEDLEKQVSKNEHGEFQLRMITPYYAAGDHQIQGIFEGLPVELEGRIAPEKVNNDKGDRLRIFRSIITCCAADLQPIGVSLLFEGDTTRPKKDDWVKAGGTLTFETVKGKVLPLIKVREVVQAEEPYSEFRLRQ